MKGGRLADFHTGVKPLEAEVKTLPLYSNSFGSEMSHAYARLP